MDIETLTKEIAESARRASRLMASASPEAKNDFLLALASSLEDNSSTILEANRIDLARATEAGMDAPRLDRLTVTPAIIDGMARACREVAAMPDPVGATETQWQRPNGMLVGRMRVPLGVVAMIYEARPNVTVDAAILCIKAGDAVILRGGKEALNSNLALAAIIRQNLEAAGLPPDAARLVPVQTREAVNCLCRMDNLIDLVIPRGGESLVRAVCEVASVPVLKHYLGVCHAYIDKDANLEKALDIVENSKTQRPGVCNALECLLVNREIAAIFLPRLASRLKKSGARFRADPEALPLLGYMAEPLAPEDLGHEFHDLILAVKIVADLDEALSHIDRYGSRHTDVICTENYSRAMRFVREADASMVGVNVSTRFNDGGQLGLGAEIGISTSKLHAYGPMGVRELTTTKFVVLGNGQIRA
ncbi:MAG: glutamate-5-semialdehyde dehydrogenase [Desulfovibrio sp.]|nr:glutamate-5-semialdehyde dehydrogenase [Desulfovibrio sp.]